MKNSHVYQKLRQLLSGLHILPSWHKNTYACHKPSVEINTVPSSHFFSKNLSSQFQRLHSLIIEPVQVKPTVNYVRDNVFIGVGSSIAYMLNELNHRVDQGNTITPPLLNKVTIIGKQDPWMPAIRGKGYISHQNELIAQWSHHSPSYNAHYHDRNVFAKSNKAHIDKAVELGAERIDAHVQTITRDKESLLFKIQLTDGRCLLSKHVTLGVGAGPHTSLFSNIDPTPAEQKLKNIKLHDSLALRDKVLNVDEFMLASDRAPEKFIGKKIVIQGAGVTGIDAVERAGELQAHSIWFMQNTKPVLPDGHHLQFAPQLAQNNLHQVRDLNIFPSEDGQLKLTYQTPEKTSETINADYYVYALGQDANKAGDEKHAASILHLLDQDILSTLEPVYDHNQIYSDHPFETVVGIQSQGATRSQGLLVVGAATAALAQYVQHNYEQISLARVIAQLQKLPKTPHTQTLLNSLKSQPIDAANIRKQIKNWPSANALVDEKNIKVLKNEITYFLEAYDYFHTPNKSLNIHKELENQIKTEVASVTASPQLAAIKTSIGALSGMMPKYTRYGEINFSSDNRTMMRTAIAQKYPNISNEQADRFINEVLRLRHLNRESFLKELRASTAQKLPLMDSQALPVHGVPLKVRQAYEDELKALNKGKPNSPLIDCWR